MQLAAMGLRLVAVMPGMVLISRNQGTPWSSTMKSARAIPDSPKVW